MEDLNFHSDDSKVYRMSIMAYIKPVGIFLIFFLIGFSLSQSVNQLASLAGYLIFFMALIKLSCDFIYTKTLRLYLNQDGVFMYRGIFPWTKGVVGTIWRDISDANYYTGFINWATKSYRVRVGHRFTKTSEIIIPHVKNGHEAVMEINETIKSRARSNC
ncbi:hypothetical protein HX773_24620 [Pantoea sp. B9002]|uniref:hypothetical protein n=1 Tax=Pantoea sp. B9002 TaxID=2726979 RepID=UPI0015A4C21C|nr:hypothetical protein [Pantoea sp. B9002]NWA64086.1 hypothetical protein [Pantoea sp. B9002]